MARKKTLSAQNQLLLHSSNIIDDVSRLHVFFDDAALGICVVSRENRLLSWNSALQEMLGYTAAELSTLATQDLTHPDDYAREADTYRKHILDEQGNSYRIEKRLKRKDGTYFWASITNSLIRNADGVIECGIGIVEDISARKEAEAHLSESEARFRKLFEQAPIGIAIVEYGGKFLEVNPAVCNFLGYSRDELLTMSVADISHPEDMKRNLQAHDDLLEGKTDYVILNKRYTAKDGRMLIGELHLRLLSKEQGQLPRFIGQVIDITDYEKAKRALIESERRFRLLIQNASDVTAIANREGIITYVSPSVEPLTGDSPESLVGKSMFERVHPDDMERARSVFETVLKGTSSIRFECRYQHKSGAWKFFESTVTNQLDEPTIQGIVLNVRDITERKQVEQQLLQAQKMEAIATLAGGVAHDFNNIMGSILVATQLVKQKPEHERTRERLEMIERAVKRGKGVVDQLLYFARDKKPEAKRLDCAEIVHQVIEMLAHSFPKDIQIINRIQERAMIFGDANQIYQAFLNLAINARDAMPNGGTLTFESETCYDNTTNKPLVAIHITDTGTGIPDEVYPRIFEPFFTTKETGKGTGLGLSVVHSVMKSHNGRIEVKSKVGEGTRFSLYFPRIE
ncbi:MAG: PAS domain S-box protein [Chloroherpetonaceae bacterium]